MLSGPYSFDPGGEELLDRHNAKRREGPERLMLIIRILVRFLIMSGYSCFLPARVAGALSPRTAGSPNPPPLHGSLVRWARNKLLPSATKPTGPQPSAGRHGLALPTLPTAHSILGGLQHH